MNRTPVLLTLPLLGALLVACGGTELPAGDARADGPAGTATAAQAPWPISPLPASAPVLILGADQRAAAALVDRLAANGVDNTWLVTQ